jgi:integrase
MAMHFMLLTLARREEVAKARWRHIDFAATTWLIPDPKNGQPHLVPLSRQAFALVQKRRPKSLDPDGLVFCTANGRALGNWDRETKRLQRAVGVLGWHRHDLRRTAATMLGEMGVLPDIVESALNHTSIRSPLAATYNRARYRKEVADALQMLADTLSSLGGKDAA